MKIHIDEPVKALEASYFHLFGWIADEGPVDARATVSGRDVRMFYYPRHDVAQAYPGLFTTGFSAFVRLAGMPELPRLEIQIICQGQQVCQHWVEATSAAWERTRQDEAIRREKLEWLAPRVRCARCGADLDSEARCVSCRHSYEEGGCLDLIPPQYAAAWELEFNGAISSFGYDADAERIIAQAEERGGMVLDCGAGFKPSQRSTVITTEIFPFPTTDVLALNQQLPFKDDVFDAVLSLHVLEHVADPFTCARELCRVLKPGGTLLACTPMITPQHGVPHHFFNPTHEGLARLFNIRSTAGHARIFVPVMGHPINGIRLILEVYQSSLPSPQRKEFLSMSVADLLAGPLEEWITQGIATALSEEGRMRLATNFSIELVKQ